MTLSVAKEKRPLVALLGLMVASLATLPLLPPIAQDPSYHQFADQRTLLGIPNFWNVASNLPFVLVGTMGLWQFGRDRASFVLFLGVFLTGFGSAYYHWKPNNGSLFWDRLPMALTFMAILTVAVEERVNAKTGAILLWPLLALAVFSLLLWRWTDDLRLYPTVDWGTMAITDNRDGTVPTECRVYIRRASDVLQIIDRDRAVPRPDTAENKNMKTIKAWLVAALTVGIVSYFAAITSSHMAG